jgi:hypothetical protein
MRETTEFIAYKWGWNFRTKMYHSLLSCRKWWRAGYCCTQECPAVRNHCHWSSALRSPTNRFPLAGSYKKYRYPSDLVDKFRGWKRIQGLASELMAPRIQINSEEKIDKANRDFTACIASVYRLSTIKITLSGLNKDMSGLESLPKCKWSWAGSRFVAYLRCVSFRWWSMQRDKISLPVSSVRIRTVSKRGNEEMSWAEKQQRDATRARPDWHHCTACCLSLWCDGKRPPSERTSRCVSPYQHFATEWWHGVPSTLIRYGDTQQFWTRLKTSDLSLRL